MKVYLCSVAKYNQIPYLNNKHEKDCPFIPHHFSGCRSVYFLRRFKKRMPYHQSKVFQAVSFCTHGPVFG